MRARGKNDDREGKDLVIFPVTDAGYALSRKIARSLPGSRVYRPEELKRGSLSRRVKEEFRRSRGEGGGGAGGLVFICAAGIAVRAVAPLLRGKHLDPAVVVADEMGGFVISLLSGHLGGANALARRLARLLNATPVITTATDIRGLACVEEIAGEFSLAIEDVGKIKTINSAILKGGVEIIDKNPRRLKAVRVFLGPSNRGVFSFAKSFIEAPGIRARVFISSSTEQEIPVSMRRTTLVLRPREFVVGVGSRRSVSTKEVEGAVKGVFKDAGLSILSIRNIATIDIKRDEAGITGFARRLGCAVEYYGSGELKRVPRSRASKTVLEKTGTGSVSEAAALISSGARRLWRRKKKAERVTVAVARVPFT